LFTKEGNPDDYLPEAHTCFFALDLPLYSCKKIMEQKLLYAITTCADIDTDYNTGNEGTTPGVNNCSLQ